MRRLLSMFALLTVFTSTIGAVISCKAPAIAKRTINLTNFRDEYNISSIKSVNAFKDALLKRMNEIEGYDEINIDVLEILIESRSADSISYDQLDDHNLGDFGPKIIKILPNANDDSLKGEKIIKVNWNDGRIDLESAIPNKRLTVTSLPNKINFKDKLLEVLNAQLNGITIIYEDIKLEHAQFNKRLKSTDIKGSFDVIVISRDNNDRLRSGSSVFHISWKDARADWTKMISNKNLTITSFPTKEDFNRKILENIRELIGFTITEEELEIRNSEGQPLRFKDFVPEFEVIVKGTSASNRIQETSLKFNINWIDKRLDLNTAIVDKNISITSLPDVNELETKLIYILNTKLSGIKLEKEDVIISRPNNAPAVNTRFEEVLEIVVTGSPTSMKLQPTATTFHVKWVDSRLDLNSAIEYKNLKIASLLDFNDFEIKLIDAINDKIPGIALSPTDINITNGNDETLTHNDFKSDFDVIVSGKEHSKKLRPTSTTFSIDWDDIRKDISNLPNKRLLFTFNYDKKLKAFKTSLAAEIAKIEGFEDFTADDVTKLEKIESKTGLGKITSLSMVDIPNDGTPIDLEIRVFSNSKNFKGYKDIEIKVANEKYAEDIEYW